MHTISTHSGLIEDYKIFGVLIVFLVLASDSNRSSTNGGYLVNGVNGLRVRGEFDLSQDFFVFLAKFGFQKTDIRDPNNTQGVIYGNITMSPKDASDLQISSENQTESKNNSGNPGEALTFHFLM